MSVCGYISDHCDPPQNVIRGVDHELSELVRWYGTENRGQSEKEGNSRKQGTVCKRREIAGKRGRQLGKAVKSGSRAPAVLRSRTENHA